MRYWMRLLRSNLLFILSSVLISTSPMFAQEKPYNLKGIEYAIEAKFTEAEGEFKKSLAVNKFDDTAKSSLSVLDDYRRGKIDREYTLHLFKGLNYISRHELEKAIDEFKAALKINPDYARAYNILGIIYTAENNFTLAEEHFKAAITKDASYTKAYYNLASFYQAQERLPEAVAYYQKAIKLDGGLIEAYLNLGIVYSSLNEHKKAQGCYKQAVGIAPQNPDACYYLGLSYFMLDNFSQAKEYLIKAKELYRQQGDRAGIEKTDKYLDKFTALDNGK